MKKIIIAALLFATVAILGSSTSANAQRRDYMTDAEIELVRDAQDIDMRIEVLTKMIDRRFLAAGIDSAGWPEPKKGSEKWGDAPTGTRMQLLSDIRQLLQKAVDDVDDVAEHNDNALTQNKTEGLLFPKAVRALSTAAQRYRGILLPLSAKITDEKEKGVALASVELCDEIIEAVGKLPPEVRKAKKN